MTSARGNPIRNLVLGPLLFALMHVIPAESLDPAARSAFGLLLWRAWWWVTQPVHLAVTGFLPLVIAAVFQVVPVRELLPAYASVLIILLLGANILATVWTRWGLDRRIAMITLRFTGDRPASIVAGIMLATAVLSMFVSNTATAAMMLPIALSVVTLLRRDDGVDNFAICMMLGIAYAASIGGIGTKIGTPPNGIVLGFVEQNYGQTIDFVSWLMEIPSHCCC